MEAWHAQLMEIIRQEGLRAGIAYLEKMKSTSRGDDRMRILDLSVHFKSALFGGEPSAEVKLRDLDRLHADVQALVALVDPQEFLTVQSAYSRLIEAALLTGPNSLLGMIASSAVEWMDPVTTSSGTTDKEEQYIEREIRNNLLHRIALLACALGDSRLLSDAYWAIDKAHWYRDRHLIKLLEPFGVELPLDMRP